MSATLLLRPEERSLVTTVSEMGAAVVVTRAELDPPGPVVIAVSRGCTEITQYARDELIGRNPRILQGPLTDRGVLDRLRQTCAAGEKFVGETVNYRKDGTPFLLQWTVNPVRGDDGRVTHFLALQRDVTALRPFAQQWIEAEERARKLHLALAGHMQAVAEAIVVLEKSKRSFQSKELGALRQQLLQLSQSAVSGFSAEALKSGGAAPM